MVSRKSGLEVLYRRMLEQSRVAVKQCKINLCYYSESNLLFKLHRSFLPWPRDCFHTGVVVGVTARLSQLDAKG
jgi:hypothetical protein